jgi:ribose transport system substrate-binding protein
MGHRLVALALAAATLAGCGNEDEAQDAASPAPVATKTIGVSLRTRSHDFYKDLEEGLKDAAKAQGFRLVVQSAEDAPTTQARQLEDFVVKHVDAIVVIPCQSDAVAQALKDAEKAEIPVFTADIAATGAKVVSHIASDNFEGGKLAGEAMAQRLMSVAHESAKLKVIVIDQPTVTSVQDRVRGFEDAVLASGFIEIVGKPSAGGERVKAQAVMEDWLTRTPDLAGVFGVNDDSALGALHAAEAAGKHTLVIVGYDATPEARAAIQRGSMLKADVVQWPRKIGEMTIDAVARHFRGEKVDPVTPVEVGIVDAQSLKAK